MKATLFIDPILKIFFFENSQHVFNPSFTLLRDLFFSREVFMQVLSCFNKFHEVIHVKTFYLWAISFLQPIIFDILLLAQANVVKKVSIIKH